MRYILLFILSAVICFSQNVKIDSQLNSSIKGEAYLYQTNMNYNNTIIVTSNYYVHLSINSHAGQQNNTYLYSGVIITNYQHAFSVPVYNIDRNSKRTNRTKLYCLTNTTDMTNSGVMVYGKQTISTGRGVNIINTTLPREIILNTNSVYRIEPRQNLNFSNCVSLSWYEIENNNEGYNVILDSQLYSVLSSYSAFSPYIILTNVLKSRLYIYTSNRYTHMNMQYASSNDLVLQFYKDTILTNSRYMVTNTIYNIDRNNKKTTPLVITCDTNGSDMTDNGTLIYAFYGKNLGNSPYFSFNNMFTREIILNTNSIYSIFISNVSPYGNISTILSFYER